MVTTTTSSNGQRLDRVAILGPFGTYSHEAALQYFGGSEQYQFQEQLQIKDVFHALSSGSAELGVVPQENSIFGSVVETYDALRGLPEGSIVGEVTIRIDHCLIVKAGVHLDQIDTVLSHEQALGQCRNFLETYLPNAKTERTTSTAEAARTILSRPQSHAAIGSRVCVTLFGGLEVLKEAIQAEKANYTRFYVLSHSPPPNSTTLSGKTPPSILKGLARIVVKQADKPCPPGVQKAIHSLEMQVSRIDRRPLPGSPFNFIYFVEATSEGGIEEWKERLERLRKLGFDADLLGTWV